MKNLKKILAMILVLAMMFTLAACGAKQEPAPAAPAEPAANEPAAETVDYGDPVVLTLAHIRPEGSSADLAIKAFCAEVTELSGGTITFEIYPASQLGDYTTVFERVMIGDVDMQCATVPTSVDKFFGISNCCYLASNWEEAHDMFASGSPIGKAVDETLAEYGVKYLCMYPFYFGGIATKVDPVDPTNPDAKSGIKIRVPSMTSFEKCAENLGYLGTPLPSSETFTSIQTGVVDGAIGMGAEGYYSNVADLINYYLPINDHFECWNFIMNMDKFNGLSAVQQEALTVAAQNAEAKRWEVAEAETAEYEKKLADEYGVTVVEFTDEQLAAFASKCRANVWPLVRDDFGGELFDQVTAGKN